MPLQDNNPSSLSDAWEPLKVLLVMACLGGLAGFAAFLRSDVEPTKRAILSAVLNSSLLAFASISVWWASDPDANFLIMVGVSLFIGLGGNTSLGIVAAIVQKKFNITLIDPKDKKDDKL